MSQRRRHLLLSAALLLVGTPAWAAITVGNGTDPGNVAIGPGGPATMLDAFTLLSTTTAVQTVTSVTVTLSTGTFAGLALVEITDDAGATVYGSAANPSAVTVVIAVSPSLSAPKSNAAAIQYKVRITPRTHANMPAQAGATYAVTGTITAAVGSSTFTYSDTTSSTVTIDNLSPANATWGTVTPGNAQVVLNWTNPGDADFSQVVILRRATTAISDVPVEGTTYTQGNTIVQRLRSNFGLNLSALA